MVHQGIFTMYILTCCSSGLLRFEPFIWLWLLHWIVLLFHKTLLSNTAHTSCSFSYSVTLTFLGTLELTCWGSYVLYHLSPKPWTFWHPRSRHVHIQMSGIEAGFGRMYLSQATKKVFVLNESTWKSLRGHWEWTWSLAMIVSFALS